MRLLQDVLAALDGQAVKLPDWDADDVASVGEVSYLVPLADALGLFEGAGDEVRTVVRDDVAMTAASVARVREDVGVLVQAFNEAGVPHVIVGGSAMVSGVWDRPECRPTTMVEIVAVHGSFERAGAVLRGAVDEMPPDVSAVLHAGWTEHLHGLVVDGFEVEPATFDHAALTTHTFGTLSAEVVRGEVRGVTVVDVWGCVRRGVDWVRVSDLMDHSDARLTAPGLWFVHRLLPDLLPQGLLAGQFARLPERAHHELHQHHAIDVLLDGSHEPSVAWSTAFAETLRERKAVVHDRLQPHPHDPELRR